MIVGAALGGRPSVGNTSCASRGGHGGPPLQSSKLVLMICVLAFVSASAQEVKKPGGSIVKGRVIYADTGQPLRRAEVSLVTQDGERWGGHTISNRSGEFVFNDVEAGSYFAIVDALDIVSPISRETMRDKSLQLRIALGQIEDGFSEVTVDGHSAAKTEIRASRGGVITGRVLTESDEPIAKAQITIFRVENGKMRLAGPTTRLFEAFEKTVETDSRGVYRIAGLATGEYIVRASESDEGGNPDEVADGSYTNGSMMVAYYPTALRVQEATLVQVQQGSETKDVDIHFTERIGHRVSGTVMLRGKPVIEAQVKLVRDEPQEDQSVFESLPARTDDKGQWEIRTVPDGKYTLSVTTPLYSTVYSSSEPRQIAPLRRELVVAGGDITNLVVEVFDGAKIGGVISVEGGGPLPPTMTVNLKPADPSMKRDEDPDQWKRYSMANQRGEFDVQQIATGSYQFDLTIGGYNYSVKSITLNGKDLLRNPIRIRAGQTVTGVKIVLSTEVVSLSGRVVDKNDKSKPLSNASVVLLPAEPERRRISNDPIVVFSDKDGRFAVKSAPGEYFVFVVDRRKGVPFELPSEASLAKNAATLQKINLQRGDEKKVVEIVGP